MITVKYKLRKFCDSLIVAYANLTVDYWKIDRSSKFEEVWDRYKEIGDKTYFAVQKLFVLAIISYVVLLVFIYSSDKFKETILKEFIYLLAGPFRGETNFYSNIGINLITGLMYFLLILVIAYSVHLSSHFIKELVRNEIQWPEKLVESYQNKYGIPDKKILGYRILLDFIKQHTDASNTFIYYPFFLLFLIILSRNYYFDNWQATPFTHALYAILIILTLTSAFRLRASAQFAKKEILDKLESNSSDAPVNQSWYKEGDNAIKLKSLINEIRDFKEGVYKPLSHHPMVLYLFLPIGSLATVYLIGHLN